MRWMLGAILTTMLITAPGGWGADQRASDPQTIFAHIDLNKDGKLDRQEFQHWISETFFLLDSNKDGKLTLAELQQAHSSIDPKQFAANDRNRDGALDSEEFQRALLQDFADADKDKDGGLSFQEFRNL